MSDPIKHECGLAFIRLRKPFSYYHQQYGTVMWGLNKLYLLMEKQHNRGLDGALDLGLNLLLSQELSKRYVQGNIGSTLGSLFADPQGRLMLDFRVGGTYRSPRLEPDVQKTASRTGLQALADTELRRLFGGLTQPRQGEGLLERTLKDAAGGLLGQSRPSAPDTTRKP